MESNHSSINNSPQDTSISSKTSTKTVSHVLSKPAKTRPKTVVEKHLYYHLRQHQLALKIVVQTTMINMNKNSSKISP